MPRIVRTALAKLDAADIWCYIANDNEEAANKLIDQIDDRLTMLIKHPHAGESVEYIRPDVRRSVVGNYVIYYIPRRDEIIVLRILNSTRRHEDKI